MRVSVVRKRRESSRSVESTPTLPRVYFVPRGGELVRFPAELRDDLCELRSELELLRRIRRRLAAPPAPQISPSTGSRNLDELLQILQDAQHPVVEEMTELLDREFPDVREEVAMTVINEEAENIVQEAVDSGALDAAAAQRGAVATGSASDDAPEGSPVGAFSDETAASIADGAECDVVVEPGMTAAQTATKIEAALAEAEAALAQVVGISTAERAPTSSTPESAELSVPMSGDVAVGPTGAAEPADTDTPSVVDDAVGNPHESPTETDPSVSASSLEELDEALAAGTASADPSEPTASMTPASSFATPDAAETLCASEPTAESAADGTPHPALNPAADGVDSESGLAEASMLDPASSAATGASSSEPPGSVDAAFSPDGPYAPERAVQAVAEIERGVRRLAALLSTEVNDQWQRASGTLEELVRARDEAAELATSARASLDTILRLRADVQSARDEAEIVRQEARLLREDTQRAKLRAEAAAQAAELAADQAAKERMEFHRAGANVTQTLP